MSSLERDLARAFQPTESRQILISRTYKNGKILVGEEYEDVPIEVRVPPIEVPQTHVTFGGKFTKNLTDFNSVSIDIRVTLPCPVEELEEAYIAAKAFVEEKSRVEFEAIKKSNPKAFKS